MNQLCSEQFNARIVELDLQVQTELKQLPGTFPDEVTLLGQISRKHFQCFPCFDYTEVEELGKGNPKMRFTASLSLNKIEVGKGYGANKKIAKTNASRMALKGMVPNVYQEWVTSQNRVTALNKQNRNGEEIVQQEQQQ